MRRIVGIVLGLLVLAGPAPARAQTVGLAPFSGPRHRVIRRAVRSALSQRVRVVDVDPSDRQPVDAVVTGETSGRRARPRLVLVLIDRDGEERARETLRVRQNQRGVRAIQRAVRSLLDAAGELAPPEPIERPPALVRGEDPDDDSEGSAGPANLSARPYLHLLAGLSLRNREFVVELPSATRIGNAVPLYPEVLAEARVRPMAGSGDDLLAGILLRLRFGYALFFESATPSDQVIGGQAFSIEGDAGWLAPLDDSVEIGLTIGGGYSTYALDDNAFVPTVEYSSFELRAVNRIRASDEQLVIRLELGYRYSAGSGPVADRYGSITGHGVVVEGGLEGMMPIDSTLGLSWQVAVQWQNSWLAYSGVASDQLGVGGSEGFVRGRIGVGLAFR